MTWPPAALPPATRTDGTPSATNHADDHNKAATVLADIVDVLGTDPAGSYPDVSARLAAVGSDVPRFGDLYAPARSTKYPASKLTVNLTTGAPSGWDYVGSAYTAATLKSGDLVETNYDADDLIPYANYLGNSHFVDTSKRPAAAGVTFQSHDLEFILDGSYVTVWFHHYFTYESIRIWVNDEEIETWQSAGVDQAKSAIDLNASPFAGFLNMSFATTGTYRIRIAGMAALSIVALNAPGVLRRPRKRRRLYVQSDSWFSQVSPTTLTMAEHIRTLTGFTVVNAAIGGTGYLKTPNPFGNPDRLARLEAEDEANLVGVIINGSANDIGLTPSLVGAAATAYYDQVRDRVGDTPIVVGTMEDVYYFRALYTDPVVEAINQAVRTAALAHPSVVGIYDSRTEDWLTGTGDTAAPTGAGNQDRHILGTDHVHMTLGGIEYSARLIVERLASMPTKIGAAA